MKKIDLANRVRRLIGWGDYWWWENPDADIPIRSLVYPLRYDVLVRRDFMAFYSEHRELYRSDPGEFLSAVRALAYFKWVQKVLIVRYYPHAVDDPRAADDIFAQRVAKSAALYDSIERHGFDPGHPVSPVTGLEILPTSTGKLTGARYYAGDGCHRLACLMCLGFETLPKSYTRAKCFRRFRPLDNTSLLEPHVPIEWPPAWLE